MTLKSGIPQFEKREVGGHLWALAYFCPVHERGGRIDGSSGSHAEQRYDPGERFTTSVATLSCQHNRCVFGFGRAAKAAGVALAVASGVEFVNGGR